MAFADRVYVSVLSVGFNFYHVFNNVVPFKITHYVGGGQAANKWTLDAEPGDTGVIVVKKTLLNQDGSTYVVIGPTVVSVSSGAYMVANAVNYSGVPTFWGITVQTALGSSLTKTVSFAFSPSEPVGTITVGSGSHTVFSDVPVSATCPSGYSISAVSINGVDQGVTPGSGSWSDTISGINVDTTITVTVAQTSYDIQGTLAYNPTSCPIGAFGVPVTPGGSVSYGTGFALVTSPSGSVAGELGMEADALTGIYAAAFDIRTRISSFIVNGVDILNADPPLTSFHRFAQQNTFACGIHFTVKESVTFAVTFSSDRFCYSPGGGGLPAPILPGGGGGISTPPTDPSDPFYIPPPNGWPFGEPTDGTPTGTPGRPRPPLDWPFGGGGGGYIEYVDGGEGGGHGGFTGGGGGGAGAGGGGGSTQFGDPGSPFGIDREEHAGEGFWVQWRNEAGGWSKEKYVSLGNPGETDLTRRISAMGKFRARQFRIVHVRALPLTLVYMEDDNHVTP